jgi:hypothetical protein
MHCNTCDGYSYSSNVYAFKLLVVGSRLVLSFLNMSDTSVFIVGCGLVSLIHVNVLVYVIVYLFSVQELMMLF